MATADAPRPLRVLHVGKYYPPHPGGMESYLKLLLAALAARGVHCTALVHGTAPAGGDGPVRVVAARVWFTLVFAPVSPGFPLRLRQLLAAERPDILHLHLPNVSAFWALLLPAARRRPWVVHWHADVPPAAKRPLLRLLYRLYRPLERQLLRRARAIIATSPPYLASSEALAPWREKCTVIPLALDAAEEPPPPPPATGPLRILAVGRLSYYKGLDVLVRAVARLPGVHLTVVGDGAEERALAALVDSLDLRQRVRLTGRLPDSDRRAALAACDCLCLPSIERSEAFGMVLLEAMAAGRACVATAVPGTGMAWVVRDGETGLVVPPGDVDALAAALQRLDADRALCRALGEAGYRRFREHFRIEASVDAIRDLYGAVTRAG